MGWKERIAEARAGKADPYAPAELRSWNTCLVGEALREEAGIGTICSLSKGLQPLRDAVGIEGTLVLVELGNGLGGKYPHPALLWEYRHFDTLEKLRQEIRGEVQSLLGKREAKKALDKPVEQTEETRVEGTRLEAVEV